MIAKLLNRRWSMPAVVIIRIDALHDSALLNLLANIYPTTKLLSAIHDSFIEALGHLRDVNPVVAVQR